MGALLDGSVAVVFATADGTVVGSGVTASDVQKTWPQAYARIQAILSGAAPTPCAEFPATGSLPGDVEGWWNSSPADAQANILQDPGLWPAEPREHPRVALVDTDTATVISTYDRIACGPDPHFVPRTQADWPPHSVAVVDIDTGKTIQILATHDNG